MPASAHRLDGDEDEFDSLFDDQPFLDPELEESLAQAEATYTASQAVRHSTNGPAFNPATPASDSSLNSRRGIFVPPVAKRQRLNPGPSNLSRVAGPSKSTLRREPGPEPDQVIIRDLRDEELSGNDDEQWWVGNAALDQVEQEAIRMSQQMPASQPPASTPATNREPPRLAQDCARTTADRAPSATLRKPPDPKKSPHDTQGAAANQESVDNDELAQLRAEVERLRSAHKAQEEMVEKLKQESYRKAGEVAVVRQNLTKLNQENSKLREREVVREQEHRTALERLQKDQERRLQRLETETAFRRVEQDTSRRIWPSSVARLPPVGLRDMDRRQESQVRAGLTTTPTKSNRFGIRGGSGSSGTRQRYADTTANRDEPGTPTRSAVKPGPHFPRPTTAFGSASKSKAFRGLQNSFADFGPVQEKIRQQRQSPATGTRQGPLAPADWDADHSMPAAYAEQEDARMADDHLPASPIQATTTTTTQRGQPSQRSTAEQAEHNYLAAISEILSRRTAIVSLLLSHSSPEAAAPASYPSNRFNPSASHPRAKGPEVSPDASFSSSTLGRLISANLVSDCPDLLLFRYRTAVDSLLTNLSKARVLEPEEREDASRLLSVGDSDQSIEELDFSSATMHLSHAIASSLMVMAGVLLRLCQTDLLTDVLRLVSCLVSMLPRFWLDLECLQTGLEARRDEIAFLGSDGSASVRWSKYMTPISLREILAQCIDDCRAPSDASTEAGESAAEIDEERGGAARRESQRDEGDTDKRGLGDWTLSSEAREDLLQAVVQVLEAMSQCPDANLSSGYHPLRILSRPGVLHKLLHPDRSSFVILNVVRMLSSAVSNAPLIHECLASKADTQGAGAGGSHSKGPRAGARFPVLELLVKHLVDRRFDLPESEWHSLHCMILTFLTQAALRSADTLLVLADSAALLAALIRCLSLDSDFVWLQSRPTFLLPQRLPSYRKGSGKAAATSNTMLDSSGADLVQATERIVMDTRLLNLLYNYPLPISSDHAHRFETASAAAQERMGSIALAAKLDQPETYSMLNGIRQSFIVALSRIAFCSEPDWISSERKLLAALLPDLRQRIQDKNKAKAKGSEGSEEGEDVWMPSDDELAAEEVEQTIEGLDRVSMLLEAIADVAGDLADLVLSPEEIDSVYDLLADEADDEDAMDVDPEELHRREQEMPTTPRLEPEPEAEAGSETESEPDMEAQVARPKPMSRTTSRGSKSVSPTKSRRGDEDVDVIEIDDSD